VSVEKKHGTGVHVEEKYGGRFNGFSPFSSSNGHRDWHLVEMMNVVEVADVRIYGNLNNYESK
jgi:hypothetical protein